MGRPRTTNSHLPKYVTVRGASYWYGPTGQKAKRICEVGDFVSLYKWLADTQEPSGPVVTLNDCFDRYCREVIPTLGERTQKDYLRAIAKLRAWCGHMKPDELTTKDVGRFLRPDGVTKGAIHRNRQVAVLSAMYSKAVGRWYVAEKNPCLSVERNESSKRTRYVTDAEFALVYEAMPPRVRIAMDLAVLTGQRQGDLLRLKWEQVTAEGVLFTPSKTRKKVGKRLLVGLSPALEEVLTRAKRMIPQLPREFVIRTEKGEPYTSEGFRCIWQRRMRRLHKAGKLPERYTFHDLRAKSVSDSASLDEAFERAGHTSMAMTRGTYDRGIRKVKPLR